MKEDLACNKKPRNQSTFKRLDLAPLSLDLNDKLEEKTQEIPIETLTNNHQYAIKKNKSIYNLHCVVSRKAPLLILEKDRISAKKNEMELLESKEEDNSSIYYRSLDLNIFLYGFFFMYFIL